MGIVVKKNAGVDTIFADGRTALTRSVARGGRWQELAEQRIAPVLALLTSIDGQIAAAREEAEPLRAARDVENERADALIGRVSDDAWNAVGRPGSDPALTLIFPGGVGYYTEGEVEGQPDRMEILAQLLESNLHPKISPAQGQAFAAEVRAGADVLRAAIDAARGPLARVGVLERVRTALARSLAMELAKLKRLYKAEGFSEAEIHAVIPDRPRESAAPATKPA
jgi:hypothetical protein